MNPYAFSVMFFGFGFFFVAVFIVLMRLDRVGYLYGIYSFFVVAWALPYSMMITTGVSESTALFCGRLCCTFSLFIGPTWLHFCSKFSEYKVSKKIIYSCYGVALVTSFFTFTDLYIPRVAPILSFDFYPRSGPLYAVLSLLFTFCVFYGFIVLYRASLKADTVLKKRNLRGLVFVSAYGYIGGTLSFLPVYEIPFPQYGLFFMPLYPFLKAFFITRRNLMNETDLARAVHKDKLATIGTLFTSINHEIKNPLYVIQGLSQSFRQNRLEKLYASDKDAVLAAETMMEKAEFQIKRAIEIMGNFSFFAKQGIDKKAKLKEVRLAQILERILPLVRYELELDKIKIQNHIQNVPFSVQGDERYLEEILFNLIINSCQAMKQTGGELKLSAKEEAGKVIIEIKDNGPGISKERQKQIFEPFYTTKEEGTGLGLYITKQLVEKIGGTIALTSDESEGATFRLELGKA